MFIEARMRFILPLLAAFASAQCTAAVDVPLTVQTSSGIVQGHVASGTSDVSEYLGIPFVRSVRIRFTN